MTESSADELVPGLKSGEPAAFEALVEAFANRLLRFIIRMVSDESAAEDLVQEVFLRVVRSASKLKEDSEIKAWLFQIAYNLAVDHLRRFRNMKIARRILAEQVNDEVETPEKAFEARERQERLREAIGDLPGEQRDVFLLREESGLAFKEIAKILGCPLNTALGRMRYAMQNLRKSFAEDSKFRTSQKSGKE